MASHNLIHLAFLVVFSFSAFESALAGRPEPTSISNAPFYVVSEPIKPPGTDVQGRFSTHSMDQVVNPTYPNYPYSSGQGYGSGYPYSGQGYPYNGQGYPYSGQPYFPNYRIPPLFPTIGGPLSYPYGPNIPYSNGPGSYPYGSGSYPYGTPSSVYGPPASDNGNAKARP